MATPRAELLLRVRQIATLGVVCCLTLTACRDHKTKSPAALPTTIAPSTAATNASTTTTPTSPTRSLALVAPAESPTCHQASTALDPGALISAFRAARLQGRDAEECLTAAALRSYSDKECNDAALAASPGPLVLYSCAGHRVVAIPDESIRVSDMGIELDVRLAGTDGSHHENLTIGPGTSAGGGEPVAQLITAVNNN